jgi:hypothetical protein
MVIKRIVVLNVELKNMFLSHVNADYVHLAGQRQLTNGLIEESKVSESPFCSFKNHDGRDGSLIK